MIDKAFSDQFAIDWIEAWNAHVLDRVLSHYSEDFKISSAIIIKMVGETSGTLRTKDKFGAYSAKALQLIPDMHFELQTTLIGVNGISLYYKDTRGPSAEVFHF